MYSEAVTPGISQNSQENTCVGVAETPTKAFSCEFYEIFKNTFFYRTPPMAASFCL